MSELSERVAGLAARTTDPIDSDILRDVLEALVEVNAGPVASVLAEIAEALYMIAENTGKPDTTVTEALVIQKWGEHMRMYEDKAIPFVKSLGITVEP